MADRYHKVYLSRPPEFEQLSYHTQAFFFYVRGHHVEPDGAIAVVKHNEKIYRAVARTYAIAPRERRRFDRIVTELFAYGFLTLHGDRVVVAHWPAQQVWRKGPPPPVRCEPDRLTLARLAHESSTTLLDHFSDTSPILVDRFSITSPTLVDHFSLVTLRNHSAVRGQNGFQPVGSARIGWGSPGGATPARPRRQGPPSGRGSPDPAGSDGAKVVDIETSEVIDPADFYDPPPEERERLAAGLPLKAPTPDQAVAAAGLFDEVEEGEAF